MKNRVKKNKLSCSMAYKLTLSIFFILAICFYGFYGIRNKRILLFEWGTNFSIGIYGGESPLELKPLPGIRNPILTAWDITDVDAGFVADPFMLKRNGAWFMFFEVYNRDSQHGDIGLAESKDGLRWEYKQIVLDEPFHLSYPFVFEWEDDVYMVPESAESDDEIRLYRSDPFPDKWILHQVLFRCKEYADPTLFRHNEFWWMYVGIPAGGLRLFFSPTLFGPWEEHPRSPVIENDLRFSRPAGRVFAHDGRLIRFAQDGSEGYGIKVWAFLIHSLDVENYYEVQAKNIPIISASGGIGWNSMKMHHIDAHPINNDFWIASVDGFGRYWRFGWAQR